MEEEQQEGLMPLKNQSLFNGKGITLSHGLKTFLIYHYLRRRFPAEVRGVASSGRLIRISHLPDTPGASGPLDAKLQ